MSFVSSFFVKYRRDKMLQLLGLTELSVILWIIGFLGMFIFFPKCGVKRWWALVPGFRNYKFAVCADMADEGKVLLVTNLLYFCFAVLDEVYNQVPGLVENSIVYMNGLLAIIFQVIAVLYAIKIYGGLCKMFGRSRKWMFLWLLDDGITMLIWGISKKFQPEYKAGEKKQKVFEAGADVESIGDGLTINIRKREAGNIFNKKTLLRDIHMNIKSGRMVLLLGGSGAGKTTFINALTGYEKADASVILDGRDVYKEFDKMKYEIGFVPQMDLMRYNDTVEHTLMDAAALRLPVSASHEERQKRVNEVMEIFGLMPVKDNIVGKQSGGQKKRISIASEFISDPKFYVLDEPDSGLDGILAKELMKRLHDISREGKIVIVITHSPDRVLDCFDDVIVLAKDEDHTGRLVYYGPVDKAKEFFDRDTMEDIVKTINREEEGGDGRADELIAKFNGKAYEAANEEGGACNGTE